MDSDKLFWVTKCKCCCCEQSMVNSEHINLVQLDYQPKWKYPVFSNLTDLQHQLYAAAVLCNDCVKLGQTGIKFAFELNGDEVIYHPINELVKLNS